MVNGLSKATGRVQRAGENWKGDNDGTKPGHYQNTSPGPSAGVEWHIHSCVQVHKSLPMEEARETASWVASFPLVGPEDVVHPTCKTFPHRMLLHRGQLEDCKGSFCGRVLQVKGKDPQKLNMAGIVCLKMN